MYGTELEKRLTVNGLTQITDRVVLLSFAGRDPHFGHLITVTLDKGSQKYQLLRRSTFCY